MKNLGSVFSEIVESVGTNRLLFCLVIERQFCIGRGGDRRAPLTSHREGDVSFPITPGPSLEPFPAILEVQTLPDFVHKQPTNDSNYFTAPAVWHSDSTSAVWEVSCMTPAQTK